MSEHQGDEFQFVMPENIEGQGELLAIAEEDISAGDVFAYIEMPSCKVVPVKKVRFLPGAREKLIGEAMVSLCGLSVERKKEIKNGKDM